MVTGERGRVGKLELGGKKEAVCLELASLSPSPGSVCPHRSGFHDTANGGNGTMAARM